MRVKIAMMSVVAVMVLALSLTAAADFSGVALGSLPDGWHVSRGNPGIYIEETSGKAALRIRPRAGASRNEWDGAFFLFPETKERVVVEFSAYAPDLFRSLAVSVSYQESPEGGATSTYGAYFTIHDNAKLTYYVQGKGWLDLGGYVDPFRWNHFKIDVDVKANRFTVYANDMSTPVGTGEFRNPMDRVNQVEFSTWGTDIKTTMWVADVRVYFP